MDPTVKALITIVDRGKGEGISAFLNRKYNQASFLAMGVGTAGSDIMAMLGLDNVDKDVVLSLVSAADLPDMLGDIARTPVHSHRRQGYCLYPALKRYWRLI